MRIFRNKTEEVLDKTINFGNIAYKGVAKEEITFIGDNITNFSAEPTCGCTVTKSKVNVDGTIDLLISYNNTHIRGDFGKSVVINYKESGVKNKIVLKIKGTID